MILESKDIALLALLQQDCRLPNAELAERIGVSPSACYRRTRALEAAGVIRKQVAMLNPPALGLDFSAIVQISLSHHDRSHVEQFVSQLLTRPEVIEVFSTTGEADFHMRVVTTNADAYNVFLDEFLLGLPGILKIQTNLILKEIKQTHELPLQAKPKS